MMMTRTSSYFRARYVATASSAVPFHPLFRTLIPSPRLLRCSPVARHRVKSANSIIRRGGNRRRRAEKVVSTLDSFACFPGLSSYIINLVASVASTASRSVMHQCAPVLLHQDLGQLYYI